MSYMADRDHIAITSGDASPTRRKVSVRDAQLLRQSLSPKVRLATLVVASRQIRNIVRQVFAGGPPGHSVRQLEFRQCALPNVLAHIHGGSELALSSGRPVDGRHGSWL